MPWDRGAGTASKYRTAEHRNLRASYVRMLRSGQVLECTAVICVFDTRDIVNPNGRAPDGLHLGHEDDGVTYRGPEHMLCNVKDGARRGRAKQSSTSLQW